MNLVRAVIPRSVRAFARSPSAGLRQLQNEVAFRLGRIGHVRMRGDWEVDCHPVSAPAFESINDQEDSRVELATFIEKCTPNMVFVDIGAHYGIFTLATLRYGGPEARVFAVEPSYAGLRMLRTNVGYAQGAERVTIYPVAIGNADAELEMLSTGADIHHFFIAADGHRPDSTTVEQWTLGTLFSRAGRKPTHMKIDVEGFEAEILSAGAAVLKEMGEARPTLFLELHGSILRSRGHDPAELLATLRDCGYTRFEHHGRVESAEAIAACDIARIVCT